MPYTYKHYTLPEKREVRCSLCSIYGIGLSKAFFICAKIGLAYPLPLEELNEYYFGLLCSVLDLIVLSDIKISRFVQRNIKKHIDIHTYKGLRFLSKLPVRGQRTRSNAKSCKRNKFL